MENLKKENNVKIKAKKLEKKYLNKLELIKLINQIDSNFSLKNYNQIKFEKKELYLLSVNKNGIIYFKFSFLNEKRLDFLINHRKSNLLWIYKTENKKFIVNKAKLTTLNNLLNKTA